MPCRHVNSEGKSWLPCVFRCQTGVKNLLAGEQQAAVTVAVEALMDAKPEAEAFATFDPKVACP
jgi:spore germination cell wall hydrolase CwlJ-like protein